MSKVLISYFSASGVTKSVAKKMAEALDANLFEIQPKEKYTIQDLDWTSRNSRSSIELNDKSSRPEVLNKISDTDEFDIVVIGFPVWWYTAPTIINTFIEENNLEGKDIYVFVTSGSSSSEGSFNDLKNTYQNLHFINSKRLDGSETKEDYINWVK